MTDEQKMDRARAEHVAELVQVAGMTRTDANATFDLAWHASSEAQRKLVEITSQAPDAPSAMLLAMAFTFKAMRAGISLAAELNGVSVEGLD